MAGCICSNTLAVHVYFLLFSDFKSCTTTPFKSNSFSRGKPKQQVRKLLPKELPVQTACDDPGGRLQGWEAHDLLIQQIETKLSQKACDQLALIGKDVSKLTGWNACDQLAVKIGQSVSKLMAECRVMSSRHSSNACRHQHSAVSIQYHPLVEANIASPTTRPRMARSM